MLKFVVLDDHPIILSGITIRIKEHYPDSIVHCVQSGQNALDLIKAGQINLIILDINVPGTDVNKLISSILIYVPQSKILIFSAHPEKIFAKTYFKLGVKGYLCKEASNESFFKALEMILKGKLYISEDLAYEITSNSFSKKDVRGNPFENLSDRELEVCCHLMKGLSVKDICRIMNLQASTISTYKTRIFEKIQVDNIIDLKKLADIYNIDTSQ